LAATRSPEIYVHDEWLQDWLKFGPLAPVLVTAFLAVLVLVGIRALTRPGSGPVERAAALFALITPGCLLLFPYFTTTTRWPLLLGIAAGGLGLKAIRPDDVSGRHRPQMAVPAGA
jgi:hypothetical protein